MTSDAKTRTVTRESILGLLTDDETARVSTAEGSAHLVEGDDYIDLENPASGVHQAHAGARARHALPRSAVSDATWSKIVGIVAR
jgi:hypothetical protein